MKNTILFLAVLLTFLTTTAQVRISEMATFSGDAGNGYVPVVIGGVNYKTLAKNFVAGKVDSVVLKSASGSNPDTVYSWTSGIRKQVGLISKLTYTSVYTDASLSGEGTPESPLSVISGGAVIGSTHIETTGAYTVADSVNTIILQYSGGTEITLPDPASYNKREITIRNISGNGATFNYDVAALPTDKWITIKSDGTDWNVIQESGEGTTITGSGGGVFIDNF